MIVYFYMKTLTRSSNELKEVNSSFIIKNMTTTHIIKI